MLQLNGWGMRGNGVGVFKLSYSCLQTSNVLSEELSARLPLAVIVFAAVCFLGANTLLTSRLDAVAALNERSS